ncbi:MAG: Crp/Fnr family transcriptional regulator [Spirochaetes bacterium]|nr:Crp/Fnr family transcriptional regulator [Spirochaetota bacterium]MBU0957153.1 Crp/Fnr family transcriptional regulator [Spirochaetota bacterium]
MNLSDLGSLHPLIACLDTSEVQELLASGTFRLVDYDSGCVIHFDTELCSKLEIIIGGEVLVERIDEEGRSLLLDRFGPGAILGGSLMFSASPAYPMTISAVSRVSLLEIGSEALFRLLCAKPDFLRAYLGMTAQRTVLLGERVKQRVRITLRTNILRYLDLESRKQQSRSVILPLTKKELARRLGVERSSLSRELAKMERDGLLKVNGRRLQLPRGQSTNKSHGADSPPN